MKTGCFWSFIAILVVMVIGTILTSEKPNPEFPCGSDLPSYLSIGSKAIVTNIEKDHYHPLYSEAMQSGGTNGGLINGTIVTVDAGPYCSSGAIWWKVSGIDAFNYENEGYVFEISEENPRVKYLTLHN